MPFPRPTASPPPRCSVSERCAADEELTDAGESLLDALRRGRDEHPLACANAVAACELAGGGITEVVITGERPDLLAAARARFEPTMVLAWGEPTSSPLWAGRADGFALRVSALSSAGPRPPAPTSSTRRLDDELASGRAAMASACR